MKRAVPSSHSPRLTVIDGGRAVLEEQLFRMLSDPLASTLDCLHLQVRLLRAEKDRLRLVGGSVVSKTLLGET